MRLGTAKDRRVFSLISKPSVCLLNMPLTLRRVSESPEGFNLSLEIEYLHPQTHRRFVNRPLGSFLCLLGGRKSIKSRLCTVLSLLSVKKGILGKDRMSTTKQLRSERPKLTSFMEIPAGAIERMEGIYSLERLLSPNPRLLKLTWA